MVSCAPIARQGSPIRVSGSAKIALVKRKSKSKKT